ncbi:MAG: tetratricopeptide repeat protein [Anaerolineae bacterium]|nr:tetratricopeptide repeat protein [Anaerolineae bacterium]
MKYHRLIATGILLGLLLMATGAYAQTATVLPFDPLPTSTPAPLQENIIVVPQQAVGAVPDYVATTQAAASEAANLAARLENQANIAFNVFGLFEVITALFTLIVPVGAIMLGVFGWQQIRQTRDQGRENKAELDRRLDASRRDQDDRFDQLRQDIERRVSDVDSHQKLAEIRLHDGQQKIAEEHRKQQQDDLHAARDQFTGQMERRAAELSKIDEQINKNADEQRRRLESAVLAGGLLPLGERQFRAGDLTGARDTYLRALKLDEVNPIIQYKLGYVYVNADDYDTAEHYLLRALELEPDFAPATAALGFTYRRMAERKEKAVKQQNGQDDLAKSRHLLEISDLYSKAENYLITALKQSPKLVDEDNESWYGSLGGLYRRRGQIDQAVDAYLNAAAVTPYSSYPFVNLAVLYMQMNEGGKMLKTFKSAERLARAETIARADNYYGFADLFTSQLALKKDAEAEETFQLVVELAPSRSALGLLRDTLQRLAGVLPERAAEIEPYIARIDAAIHTDT